MDFLPPNSLTITAIGGEKSATPSRIELNIDENTFYGQNNDVNI